MTKKRNANGQNQNPLSDGLELINSFWHNASGEFDKVWRTARQQGKKSAATLRKTVDGFIDNLGANDIRKIATQKSGALKKEIKKISRNVIDQIRAVENPLADGRIDDVVGKIRDNVTSTVNRIQDLEVVEYARHRVTDTTKQVLSALQIPSNDEIENLSRKVAVLERKLNTLKRHDARN